VDSRETTLAEIVNTFKESTFYQNFLISYSEIIISVQSKGM